MNEQSSNAIAALDSATSAAELNLACEQVGKSLGLPHFYYVHRKLFGRVGLLGHNCGSPSIMELLPIDPDSGDPVSGRAIIEPAPFSWSAADYAQAPAMERTAYRARAALGYRSGICAAFHDNRSQSVHLVLASDAPTFTDDGSWTAYSIAFLAANTLLQAVSRIDNESDALIELTHRERDCLLYVLAGASAKVTARALDIGTRSVNQYLERARQRLGASNSFQAALAAARLGLIDSDEAQRIRASTAPDVGQA